MSDPRLVPDVQGVIRAQRRGVVAGVEIDHGLVSGAAPILYRLAPRGVTIDEAWRRLTAAGYACEWLPDDRPAA